MYDIHYQVLPQIPLSSSLALSWEEAETRLSEKELFNLLQNKVYLVSHSADKLAARILTQKTMTEKVLSFLNMFYFLVQEADNNSTCLHYTDE